MLVNKTIIQNKPSLLPKTKKCKTKYKGGTKTTKLKSPLDGDCPLVLEKDNADKRDQNIVFVEKGHQYFINGDFNYISVTTIVRSIFPKFDTDGLIEKMILDKNPKYKDKSPETIKLEWKNNGEMAAMEGTRLHRNIELYSNGIPVMDDSKEFNFFLIFKEKYGYLEAYRTEWFIYDEEFRIAGSIDMIYKDTRDDTYHIYDWKRTKPFSSKSSKNNVGFGPFSNIPNSNLWHYSLQLNIYKYLLEKNYNKIISSMTLCRLHPNSRKYQLVDIKNMTQQVELLLDIRKQQIQQGKFNFEII